MLLKTGVDITRLKRQIRRALNTIDRVFREEADEELIITSTYEGNHSPSSLHYANLAIDARLPAKNPQALVRRLRVELGDNYDVVLEHTHIHVEHDPKIHNRR